MSKVLVVFDFCETITNFQTADAFVNYVNSKHPNTFNKITEKILTLLTRLRVFALFNVIYPKKNIEKRLKLLSIRGQTRENINICAKEFFDKKIISNYHQEIITKLRNHVDNDDIVVISSGGYDVYLRFFCEKERIKYLNCTKIKFKDIKCLGIFDGPDCMFDQKVSNINKLIAANNWSFSEKIVYSDSITDMPLFLWADQAYVISRKVSQAWANNSKFHEIIIL